MGTFLFLAKKSFKSVFGDMAEKLKSARVHSREMTSTPIYNSPLKITDDNNKVLSKTNEWNGFTESDKAEKDEGEENSYEEDSDDIITSKKRAEDLESELKLKAHTLSNTLFQWESDVDRY